MAHRAFRRLTGARLAELLPAAEAPDQPDSAPDGPGEAGSGSKDAS